MEQVSQSHKSNSDPMKSYYEDRRTKKESIEFEFCKVCKMNHDQFQRHKYFPNHKKSLSNFLSRFETKLSDVRFFLKNPTPLRLEHAALNRLWCVFCDMDIDEIGSSFACTNAIKHLASADHLKNLKHFLWKNGGGKDRVDAFRVTEADVSKWEKKCKSQTEEAAQSSAGAQRTLLEPSNDIHNQINYGNNDSFINNSIYSVNSSISNGVMPLQNHTNEYQVSHSGPSYVSLLQDVIYPLPSATYSSTCQGNLKNLIVKPDSQQYHLCNNSLHLADGHFSDEGMYQVYQNQRMVKGESSSAGLQNVTQISSMDLEDTIGNVHSGAPPPWLEAAEGSQNNVQGKSMLGILASPFNKSGKAKKLNPQRVGAAWAEKRKIELEMEKRGEIVKSNYDADWLPNFGRVWQSGSRKESRKEFQTEKPKLLKVESQPMKPVEIQPYISKRMRRDNVEDCSDT